MTGSVATRFEKRQKSVSELSEAVAVRLKADQGASAVANKVAVEPFTDLGANTTYVIDWGIGGVFRLSPTDDFTVSFINTPKYKLSQKIVIEVVAGAGLAITLPSGGTWGDIGTPTLSANMDLISVLMRNGEVKSYWMLSFPG